MRTSQRLAWQYPPATLAVVGVAFDEGSSGRNKHRTYFHVLIISQSIIKVVA